MLSWRERAELADFLEGAGTLLIQQLDELQALRKSGSAVGGGWLVRLAVSAADTE